MNISGAFYSGGSFRQPQRTFFGEADGLPSRAVSLLSVCGGRLFAGGEGGLFVFDGGGFCAVPLGGELRGVSAMCVGEGDELYAACAGELFLLAGGRARRAACLNEDITSVKADGGRVFVLTDRNLYLLSGGKTSLVTDIDNGGGRLLAVKGDELYAVAGDRLLQLFGKRRRWHEIMSSCSGKPDGRINALAFDGAGHLWLGTDDGLCIYDNKSFWLTPQNTDVLPAESIYDIADDGTGGKYFASDNGLIYLKDGALKYFGARRYLPSRFTRAAAAESGGGVVWAATDGGVSRLEYVEMTLLRKAELYEEGVRKYHTREGFVVSRECIENEDITTGRVEISDNDGLWTARYVAAECFRFMTTGDRDAADAARRSLEALLLLTRISGIDGFTARAIRREGEPGWGDGDGEWHMAPDGSCEWKGETSSDEMVGHFLAYSLYYDSVADEDEKREICAAVCAIVDHIMLNDGTLVDLDGLPTTWAVWTPELLNNSDGWYWERGINSFEMLAFLKCAYHMSGDEKYNTEYKRLIGEHHFAMNVVLHKVYDAHDCHIDDNLGFLTALILLRLEKDESLLALYKLGMERHFRYERVERSPLWNLIYGAFSGRACALEEAVQSMREMPLSLVCCPVLNSTRKGLVYDDEHDAWGGPRQLKSPLPLDEGPVCDDDTNPFSPDGGDGTRAMEGTRFLLAYWLGRYYGLIRES